MAYQKKKKSGKKKKRKADPDPSTTNSLILHTDGDMLDIGLDTSTASLPPFIGGGSPAPVNDASLSLTPPTSLPVRIQFVCVSLHYSVTCTCTRYVYIMF